jgi:hypothetical protein
VSNVLNRPDTVPEATRQKVTEAVTQLGYVRGGLKPGQLAPHWRRSGFSTWLFQPAATGWYPRAAPHPPRLVPILGGAMRQRLMDDLTELWEEALDVRRAMAPGSPVRALNRLLRGVIAVAQASPSGASFGQAAGMTPLGAPHAGSLDQ